MKRIGRDLSTCYVGTVRLPNSHGGDAGDYSRLFDGDASEE